PVAGVACGVELFAFDWRVRDHAEHLLVAPDVVFERRHVEVAEKDRALGFARLDGVARPQLVEEGELVREFRIDLRIGLVAAGRHVEIMQRDRIAQAGTLAELRRDVPAVVLVAEALDAHVLDGQARDQSDAVIALLPVDRDMLVAELGETLEWKLVVRTLGLLQAQHIRLLGADEARHQIDAQADRVDVPAGDFQSRHSLSPATPANIRNYWIFRV